MCPRNLLTDNTILVTLRCQHIYCHTQWKWNFHCVKMKMETFFFLDCLVSCDTRNYEPQYTENWRYQYRLLDETSYNPNHKVMMIETLTRGVCVQLEWTVEIQSNDAQFWKYMRYADKLIGNLYLAREKKKHIFLQRSMATSCMKIGQCKMQPTDSKPGVKCRLRVKCRLQTRGEILCYHTLQQSRVNSKQANLSVI